MPYETQSQWTIDELKKLNKATLIGMHKAYLALIIVLEVEIMGKSENADAKWFRKLAEYLEKIVNVASQGSFISVTN